MRSQGDEDASESTRRERLPSCSHADSTLLCACLLLFLLQQPASLLTFEGASFQGPQAIVEKFKSLPFTSIQHQVKSCDCAPSAAGIIVFVTGDLKVEGEVNALKFGQVFLLMPTAPNSGNFYVHNDVFRLNYG